MSSPPIRKENPPVERISYKNDARNSSLASLQGKCVNIWIWTKEAAQCKEVYYGHVALEVNTGGQANRKIYISFWESCTINSCGNNPHLHYNKEDDDLNENKRTISKSYTYTLYTLDNDKIVEAFEHFKGNYKTLSKLRVGWFRTYPVTNIGLAAYLLDVGGIGKLHDRGDQIPGLAKICMSIGVISAAFTFYSAGQLKREGMGPEDILWTDFDNTYTESEWLLFHMERASSTLNSAQTTLQKIKQTAQLISAKVYNIENAKEIYDKCLNIIRNARGILYIPVFSKTNFLKQKKLLPSDITIAASETISAIGREILYSVAAITVYYAFRIYLTGAISSAQEINVIARKSTKKEARERYKKTLK